MIINKIRVSDGDSMPIYEINQINESYKDLTRLLSIFIMKIMIFPQIKSLFLRLAN